MARRDQTAGPAFDFFPPFFEIPNVRRRHLKRAGSFQQAIVGNADFGKQNGGFQQIPIR